MGSVPHTCRPYSTAAYCIAKLQDVSLSGASDTFSNMSHRSVSSVKQVYYQGRKSKSLLGVSYNYLLDQCSVRSLHCQPSICTHLLGFRWLDLLYAVVLKGYISCIIGLIIGVLHNKAAHWLDEVGCTPPSKTHILCCGCRPNHLQEGKELTSSGCQVL